MNAWKVICATLVIFIAGVVTGGVIFNYSYRTQLRNQRYWLGEHASHRLDYRQHPVVRDPAGRDPIASPKMASVLPRMLRADFLQNLDREIRLTDEQRERIEQIISDGQERNRQLWNRMQPELRREMQETRERIRAVLQPEQVKRFEELMKQRSQRKGDEPMMQPDRRLRDQSRRASPPREKPLPENP